MAAMRTELTLKADMSTGDGRAEGREHRREKSIQPGLKIEHRRNQTCTHAACTHACIRTYARIGDLEGVPHPNLTQTAAKRLPATLIRINTRETADVCAFAPTGRGRAAACGGLGWNAPKRELPSTGNPCKPGTQGSLYSPTHSARGSLTLPSGCGLPRARWAMAALPSRLCQRPVRSRSTQRGLTAQKGLPEFARL